MPGFSIEELAIPATLDAEGGADFAETTRVRNAVEAEVVGSLELAYEPAELLPIWLDPHEPKRLFAARVGGRIVARAVYETQPDDERAAWLAVEVLGEHRRRGIGAALHESLTAIAREEGRDTLQGYVSHGVREGEPRLVPPTGFGSIRADSPEVSFLTARGYRLEQIERFSRLPLPVAPDLLSEKGDAARAVAGDDYRVVRWTGATPAEWLDDMARMRTRMSTEAPSAGMQITEERWDADRVRDSDALLAGSPRIRLLVAVEHLPSGTLVGYTELSVPPEAHRPVVQEDSYVMGEHRGHRLGMLLKVANLEHLAETHPGRPAVTTFNAEENRHMLSVNEAVGFVPAGYEGAWKATLT